jgi:hypothetical protein
MVEYHIPEDIRAVRTLLPLPNESERARRRMAEAQALARDPSAPRDPLLEQVDLLGRHARSWSVFALPAGGTRHTVWFGAGGMGHIDSEGRPTPWNVQPRMKVPPDTVLDVVYLHGVLHALDAWSLPSPGGADLFAYRTRGRLLDRLELLELLAEACGETERLRVATPFPLLEWARQPADSPVSQALARIATSDPPFDLFLLRSDQPRRSSSSKDNSQALTSFSWTARDETTFAQVNELFNYIAAKQLPLPPPPPSAQPQQRTRGPPIAVAVKK